MFKIKSYGKSELALLMFPKMNNPNTAQDKLLRWIKKDPSFHHRLVSLGSTKDANDYNPLQVRLIVERFGAPGEYE